MGEHIPKEQLRRGVLNRSQLLPLEKELFLRWYRQFGEEFDDYQFAVLFGPWAVDTTGMPEGIKNVIERVTRLRADFIARKAGRLYLFEIKPTAKPGALGQLRSYLSYFHEEFPNEQTPQLAIITEHVPVYMEEIYRREGVHLYVV